jgi:hypothetical protein
MTLIDSASSLTFLLCDPDGVALICALKLHSRSPKKIQYSINIWQFEPSSAGQRELSAYTKYPVLIDQRNVADTGLTLKVRLHRDGKLTIKCSQLVGQRRLPYELLRVIVTRASLLLTCLLAKQYQNRVVIDYPIEDGKITLTGNTVAEVRTLMLALEDMEFKEAPNGAYTVIDANLNGNDNDNLLEPDFRRMRLRLYAQ